MQEREWTSHTIGHAPPPNLIGQEQGGNPKKPKPERLIKVVIILFSLLAIWLIIRLVLPEDAPDNPLSYDPVTLEPKAPEGLVRRLTHFVLSRDITLKGEREDRVNILLLGIGGAGHDGPYLSDTILLASIKPSTKQLALTSIPRDLMVEIPGHGQNKINAANAFGEEDRRSWGGALAAEVAAETLNIDIPYYIRIDFQAFKEIIDTVGGISVYVDASFTDPMYPTSNFGYRTVSFARGEREMDGKTALEYARSRHGSGGEGSDFARSRRQQKVLLSLKQKILESGTIMGPIQLKAIMDSLDAHMTTNMSFPELLALLKIGRELDTAQIQTLTLDASESGYLQNGVTDDGAFVLVPKSGNFTAIRDAIEAIFVTATVKKDDTPRQKTTQLNLPIATSTIEIQNGTWRAGLAARMKKRLEDRGFAIATIGNTDERPQPKSGIIALQTDVSDTVLEALKTELHIPIRTELPASVTPAPGTQIFILLGEDMEE
ncbi:MAG: LCP family protein [Patescibacteria group bacterium]